MAGELGFPVVMKVSSADFPHRSDAGLVRLGVSSATEARAAYGDLVSSALAVMPEARVDGVQVQQQMSGGTEMIVGITRDSVFGPAVLVGTGGVFAEVLADTAVRPLPLDRRDAEEMISSLRGYSLLTGARGQTTRDVKSLLDTVMAVARLATACGDRLEELDLNPVMVLSDGAFAVDSLVVAR